MLHPAAVGPLLSSRGLPTIRDMDSGSLVAWVTVLLLAVNAVLVWMYLGETKKIRIANEAQLEAQLMPAVVVRHVGSQALQLVNVGKGPALHIKLSAADRGSLGARGQVSIADEIPYLEPGPLTTSIPVRTTEPELAFSTAGACSASTWAFRVRLTGRWPTLISSTTTG